MIEKAIKFKVFQERAIKETYQFIISEENNTKHRLIISSPTGSGKTLMMLESISRVISSSPNENFVFLWLTPGQGDLATQSKRKVDKFFNHIKSEVIRSDDNRAINFEPNNLYFLNWEKITKKGNKLIAEREILNLHDSLLFAREKGYKFIVFIDEEHFNNTKKADEFLSQHVKPYKEIRVSATATRVKDSEFIEIRDSEVIDSGLITKLIYINIDLAQQQAIDSFESEADILIKKAENKRKEILQEYNKLDKEDQINPLVLIQLTNNSEALLESVIDSLEKMDKTTQNGKVAIWLSEQKINQDKESLSLPNSPVEFLIFKQAIATGWDCPRAKVLVKLRNNMSEEFEVQTIGRIRRMPSHHHFDNDLIDNCFLYTFDDKFKAQVQQVAHGVDVKLLRLRRDFENITLIKQERNQNKSSIYDWEITLEELSNFLINKYDLSSTDLQSNKDILSQVGYNMDLENIHNDYFAGIASEIKDLNLLARMDAKYKLKSASAGSEESNAFRDLSNALGLDWVDVKALITALFTSKDIKNKQHQILDIPISSRRTFLINNIRTLLKDVNEFKTQVSIQDSSLLGVSNQQDDDIKTVSWSIPFEDIVIYDSTVTNPTLLTKNVYEGYDSSMSEWFWNNVHSRTESLFEQFAQKSKFFTWFYKNGDLGKKYFSLIVKQHNLPLKAFYPDYICMDKNNNIWIIEAKGGRGSKGESKQIDGYAKVKFDTLKAYVDKYNASADKKYNLKFAFVRDDATTGEELFISNTQWEENINASCWINIKQFIKQEEK
ncbi:DEAD/DEAH box helicase [Mycoplasma seminis]|uniref:DEAD/DEAH box helicase family protein n=1 Tax=Mycoplasma seminis TaxID=512749 RepID=A0ABY9HC06_9MOLU|nr:DEAD/DEAH box helicase family protein [Mycoplasma seminis]WLP85903.1 DEAD/DEAH box helicase family protein [Mycoplasma seminis]